MINDHSNVLISTMERQVLRGKSKRNAVDSISTKPNKIIRTKFISDNNFTLSHEDFNVRKAMYTERRRYYLHFPMSLNEAITQINQIKEKQN